MIREGFGPRLYRRFMDPQDLVQSHVRVLQTDLTILATCSLKTEAERLVVDVRREIEEWILGDRSFVESLVPVHVPSLAPAVVRKMADAARICGVGPMAAVAGAVAEVVGRGLLPLSDEVIVENGGDIFIRSVHSRRTLIHAGRSPLSERIGLRLRPTPDGIGICTSSGTIGHSISFGDADACVVLCADAALADAAATALGNRVHGADGVQSAVEAAADIQGILGVVIVRGEELGIWGDVELFTT